MKNVIERIKWMEKCFDTLQEMFEADPAAVYEEKSLQVYLFQLTQYYESGQWMLDYELDEKGLLPPDLKRGVLSQDALFDFLERINRENRTMFE